MQTDLNRALRIRTRYMHRRDDPLVLAIARDSRQFPNFEEDLAGYRTDSNVVGRVAEYRNDAGRDIVVGFLIYGIDGRQIELHKFAVAREHRRRGVGAQMAATLAYELSDRQKDEISLTIHERNLGGQLFLKAMGYRACGILKGRYPDGDWAFRMCFRLGAWG